MSELQLIEAIGRGVLSCEGAPLILDSAESLWLVLEGSVELFASQRSESDGFGFRHHFLSVQAGMIFFGFEVGGDGVTILAQAERGTRLLALDPDPLRRLIHQEDRAACRLLEAWVEALGRRLHRARVPLLFTDVSYSAETLLVDREARALVATGEVAWVRQRVGTSSPLADASLPLLREDHCYPLSRLTWVLASPQSEFAIFDTVGLAGTDVNWQGVRFFNAVSLELLRRERDRTKVEGGRRMLLKSASDATLVDHALKNLTKFAHVSPDAKPLGRSSSDPLFSAMRVIAEELRIPLVAPVAILRGEPLTDPIGAIARASSIRVRRVALRGDWWKNSSEPLLCFMEEGGRPVALTVKSSTQFEIYDPQTGRSESLSETLALALAPMGCSLYRPFPRKVLSALDLLWFGLPRCRSEILVLAGAGTVAGALSMLGPYATGVTFDRLIPGAEKGQLLQLSLVLVVVALTSSMFLFIRGVAFLRVQGKLDASLQAGVWDRLLGLPVSFFRDYSSGDLAQRCMGINQIRDILTGSALNAILSSLFSVFSFGLMFFYSYRLAALASGLVFLASLVSFVLGIAQLHHNRDVLRLSGSISSRLLQFVTGISKLRVTGTEARAFASWAEAFAEQKAIAVKTKRLANHLGVFNSVFYVISLGMIFYANAFFDGKEQITTGSFLAFVAAFSQFLAAALALSNAIVTLVNVVPIYERAKPILQALPEINDANSQPGLLSGRIELTGISFAYRPDLPQVLQGVTLRIESGEFVAFVGSSGCGKSTLLRLLLGFERPQSGAIYYDGQDLIGLDVQAVRRQIGVVLQTSRPVSGSIFQNIVGSAPLTIDDAWEACRLAGLEEDIRGMPMGLHTSVSDGGGGISGGQKQRLMIARAIVGKPRILLFDEATSALDNRTQSVVNASLQALQATRIVIAHRLSTIIHADRIFVLDKGRVAESGSYAELMERNGRFRELAQRQLA